MKALTRHTLLRKVLSAMLALVLVLGLVPVQTVHAADPDTAAAQTAAEAAGQEETAPADAEEAPAEAEEAPEDAEEAPAEEAEAEPAEEAAVPAEVEAEPAVQDADETAPAVTTSTSSDGDPAAYTGAWKSANYKPGTYTVTANIKMPGQYNPVLTGVDVYANNPNNPFGPTLDPDDPAENVQGIAPTTPLQNNATLTVQVGGTLVLNLPIKNPIFTTQEVGTSANLAYTATRLVKTYTYGKNSEDGRVYKLDATLGKTDLTDGVATYTFKGSRLYALPLNMTFQPFHPQPRIFLSKR